MTGCHDVAIAGGGPAGTALAGRLAAAGRSVVVVESSGYARERVGESLAPAVAPLLRDLGVWESFLRLGPLPSWGTRSRWGGEAVESHSHLTNAYQHGWHVDRRAVDELLAESAQQRGAEVRRGCRVRAIAYDGQAWSLQVGAGPALRARVVVDATGRQAVLARRLGARRLVFDRLVGVGGRWQRAGAAGQYVLVEAVAAGWWYSAPLPGGELITMLMTDADLSRLARLRDMSPWLGALRGASATSARTAGAHRTGAMSVEAATSVRTRRTDTMPWLGVGDAALAVDPITGSGVVRALRTASAAAESIEQLLDAAPAARPALISAYERARDLECDEYLRTRLGYYGAVRDHDTDFWRRRNRRADAET